MQNRDGFQHFTEQKKQNTKKYCMNRQNYPTKIEIRKVVDSSGVGVRTAGKDNNGKGDKGTFKANDNALFLLKQWDSKHHFSYSREPFLSRIGYICHISQCSSNYVLRPVEPISCNYISIKPTNK